MCRYYSARVKIILLQIPLRKSELIIETIKGRFEYLPLINYDQHNYQYMQNSAIQGWVRWVLLLCAAGLIAVLFFPMWRIDLQAPQYPEGLMLLIYPHKLGGNVDIINGLNHYIGMKTLHTKDFIEFTLLPYIIVFFAAAFIGVAFIARKKTLYLLFFLFVSFGILAMYDFWRWEYNYGHNLNPEAAIIVPGMAYQPPLIGFKQLLNFGAYSIPDIGGWIFIGVGALLVLAVAAEWKMARKSKTKAGILTVFFIFLLGIDSCTIKPEAIKPGLDNCYFCKMTVSDARFGAELITTKGKIYKFDDAHCVLSYLKTNELKRKDVKNIYITNFCNHHQLIEASGALLLKSDYLRSPMGGNIAAFDSKDSMSKTQERFPGNVISWSELINQ
jgi:copper chaperone NosL